MKFGVRECVDVMFKAKATRSIGNKIFYKDEPVMLFDTLTTSTLEGAGSTVYVQGGRGNARLMAWDGERTVTFSMTNALLSKESIAVLTSAQLIDAGTGTGDQLDKNMLPLYIHTTSRVGKEDITYSADSVEIKLPETPVQYTNDEDYIYVMLLDDAGDMKSEPYIATIKSGKTIQVKASAENALINGRAYNPKVDATDGSYKFADFQNAAAVLVDYYVKKTSGAFQVEIAPEAFGGNFYIEGSTLFRDQASGKDLPAEIIIPNGKIQSNFTFTMSGSGDPSSFDFVLDAFPDYTRFDKTKKVFADIQVVTEGLGMGDSGADRRPSTESTDHIRRDGEVYRPVADSEETEETDDSNL